MSANRRLSLNDRYSVLQKVDLVRLLRDHFGRDDLRVGMNTCCFHEDRHPSMVISGMNHIQRYKCKSCDAQGTAYDFLSSHLGLKTTKEAVKFLKSQNYLIGSAATDFSDDALEKALEKESGYEDELVNLRNECVKTLEQGISNPDYAGIFEFMIAKFCMNPDHAGMLDIGIFDWNYLKSVPTLTDKLWKGIGFKPSTDSKLQVCLVNFLRSSRETVSGFILRPTGLSSKEARQYSVKGVMGFGGLQLLDLEGILEGESTMMVEGFSDMTMLQSRCLSENGIHINCISTCGTSGFDNPIALDAVSTIVSHKNNRIMVWPDNDKAGVKAVTSMCKHLHAMNIKLDILLPPRYLDGMDPCAYVAGYKASDFGERSLIATLSQSGYNVPSFFYSYATELIYQEKIEDDPMLCLEKYADVAVEAKLTHSDLEMYSDFVTNGYYQRPPATPENPKPEMELVGTVLVKVSKESFLAHITSTTSSHRELQIGSEYFCVQSDAVTKVVRSMEPGGGETVSHIPLTNWSFRLNQIVKCQNMDGESSVRYVGDFTHAKPSKNMSNIQIWSDDFEPAKFVKALATKTGGSDFHYPTKSADLHRVRDVCLHEWHDTDTITARSSYGYFYDEDKQLVYLNGSNYITVDKICKNNRYFVDVEDQARHYGFSCEPTTVQSELNKSVKFSLEMINNIFVEGYSKYALLPFMGVLASPLWFFAPEYRRFVIYTTGAFGSGKTSLQRVMRLLLYQFDHRMENGLSQSSTMNSVEVVLSRLNDQVAILDDIKSELSQRGGLPLVQLIQSIYDGTGRGRLNKDLKLSQTHTSRCTIFMNGEDFPSLAQGSTFDRILYQYLEGGKLNTETLDRITTKMEDFQLFQGWVPAYIQFCMRNGLENADNSFLDGGQDRVSQHGTMMYRSLKTFIRFCVEKCGYSSNDPVLAKLESDARHYLMEIVSSTLGKATEESKWRIFQRSVSQLLKSGRACLKTSQMQTAPTMRGTCIGEVMTVRQVSYVSFYPTIAIAAIKKEISVELSRASVFGSMKSDEILITLNGKNGKVLESTENNLWLLRATNIFDDEEEVSSYVGELNRSC